jgi:hypothetical protein
MGGRLYVRLALSRRARATVARAGATAARAGATVAGARATVSRIGASVTRAGGPPAALLTATVRPAPRQRAHDL